MTKCEVCHGDTNGVWARVVNEPLRCVHCLAEEIAKCRQNDEQVTKKLDRILALLLRAS